MLSGHCHLTRPWEEAPAPGVAGPRRVRHCLAGRNANPLRGPREPGTGEKGQTRDSTLWTRCKRATTSRADA